MKKNLFIKQIRSILFFSFLFSIMTTGLIGEKRGGRLNLPGPLYKADAGQFDGNRIRTDLENNGMLVSHRITGHSGMEWPKGSHLYINFASGLWIAGKVDGQIRTAVAEYGPEFVAGPWGSDQGAAEHKLYIVNKSDLADPLASDDFQNWPVDLGAPWVDEDGDGVYTPLPAGLDHPEFIGDQVIWWVMNDGYQAQHSIFNTLPLGVELQMTIWGYDRPDAFGDMMFVKALIINKSGVDVDSTIIGLWADPDLGDAGDDFVGCDTTLSLGFCYNDGSDSDYGGDPPAIGYDFFQGPIVESAGDTAFAYGRLIPGYKNLEMSSFTKYINGDPVYADPNTAEEAYNYMSGFRSDGSPFINSETGEAGMFVHPDDPNLNTGAGDGVWVDSDDHASGDRRFLMNAGPFTLAAGDSQEVVFGMIIARGNNALSSITALKQVDQLAQLAYDIQFALPASPISPDVAVSTSQDAILLTWDDGVNAVESYVALDVIDKLPVPVSFDTTWVTDIIFDVTPDTVIDGPDTTITMDTTFTFIQIVDNIDTTFEGENTTFTFQGYNVYQLETASGQGAAKRVATYDLIDGITEIFDDVFDATLGEIINRRVQFGSDSGIKRSIEIDTDGLNGGIPLKTNRAYYFAVTTYGYNPYGIPRTLESSMNIITIRPQIATTRDEPETSYASTFATTHSVGGSDGSVSIMVIDPLAVTGDDYQVTFIYNADSSSILWNLTNTTTNELLVSGNPIQGGVNLENGDVVGVGASPIVEGIQVMVSGPALDFKNFQCVANAAGPLDPIEAAGIVWQGFPVPKDADPDGYITENQQVGEGHWAFHTGGGGRSSYETFLSRSMRGTNFERLVPYDWEMRFTSEGSYAVRAFEDGLVVHVPFELWNVGIATYDDDSDDYRVIPWFLSLTGVGANDLDEFVYQVEANDHAASGADNDPYTDWIYWRIPEDKSFGSAGYDAFVASLDFTTDPPNEGTYGYGGAEVIARSVLVNWNGGDVTDPTWPANVNQLVPEEGTIFRLISTKPNALVDVFTFSTDSVKTATVAYDPKGINVWPNPYFAYNPEERTPLERQVTFTHLPEDGTATIRVFNLAGELVRKMVHNDGTQYEVWNLTNNFNIPVASGMYIAHIETASGDKLLKIAVIQPEERIDVY